MAAIGSDDESGDLSAIRDFFEQTDERRAIFLGPEFVCVAANANSRERFGGRDLIGHPYFQTVSQVEGQGFEEVFRQVLTTGEPVAGEHWPSYVHTDAGRQTSWVNPCIYPWRDADGQIIGVMTVVTDVTDHVVAQQRLEADMKVLSARYDKALEIVDTLQRALLPDVVPVLPRVDVAGRYLLAADDQAAGGDWFDVHVRRSGRVTAVVGDVVGHGIQAAATMAQTRAIVLDRLQDGASIVETAAAVNRRAHRDPASYAATLCLVDLDPETGAYDYITMGHPPPLVVTSDVREPFHYIAASGGSPLGTTEDTPVAYGTLRPGEVLALYSDGVVELPGIAPTQATVDLGQYAHDAARDRLLPFDSQDLAVERVVSQTLLQLTKKHGHTDDLTMVALSLREPPPRLSLTVVADERATSAVQEAIEHWALPLHIGIRSRATLTQVITELVDNACEHAYAGLSEPGGLRVDLELMVSGHVALRVSDDGSWKPPSLPGDGRGLGLVIVDKLGVLAVSGSPTGTSVLVHLPLLRQAGPFPTQPRAPRPATATDGEVWFEAHPMPTVVARGVIDSRVSTELASQLARSLKPGSDVVMLDLSTAEVVSSAAIRTILLARDRALGVGNELQIYAPSATPADHVLTIAAVPHVTELDRLSLTDDDVL